MTLGVALPPDLPHPRFRHTFRVPRMTFPPVLVKWGLALCCIASSVLVPSISLSQDVSPQLPARKVVILKDGDSWYFDSFVEKTTIELRSLAKGSYDLEIVEVNASWDSKKLKSELDTALTDEATDLIFAAGIFATEEALILDEKERIRPVLGGAVDFFGSLDKAISEEGTSKISNYSFITNPQRVAADMEALKRLSGSRAIHTILDRELLSRIRKSKDVASISRSLEETAGVQLTLVPVGNTVESILAAIPPSAKAVYVAVLPRLAPTQRKRLFEVLAKRGVFSLSVVGLPDVKHGATAGLAPDNGNAVAKRAALNAHQILLGINPQTLPVYLPVEDRLVINRTSANLANWSPDYETALTADFLNHGAKESGAPLSLTKALKFAAQGNADVLIQKEQETIAAESLNEAKSFQRPTIDLKFQQSITDYTDIINPLLTPDRLSAGKYGVQLRQSLFNDTVRSGIRSARENVTVEKLGTRSRELDAMEAAGVAFLNYLAAKSLWEIQRENLRLSENNLQLSNLRHKIGAVELSETYRWEQNAASSRASVFQFDADRDNARIELNRILGQPRERDWAFIDIELGDHDTYFMDNILSRYLKEENDVARFGEFLRKVSVPASPELAAFDYGLSAQGIILGRVERSFFLPEFSAVLGFDRVGQGTENLDYTTQGEASAAVVLSFPLYEGGLRTAELGGQKAVVRQIEAQREGSLQLIEQRALTSLNGLSSEHPNIRLSRRGLIAAEKNYEAVREKYSQGADSILDLLDAQSALLRQRQQASLAVYSFLIEIVRMQRSIAWFEHEKSAAEKVCWEKMLATYMSSSVLEIPGVVRADRAPEPARERARAAVFSATEEPVGKQPPVLRARPVEKVSTPDKPGLFKKLFKNSAP